MKEIVDGISGLSGAMSLLKGFMAFRDEAKVSELKLNLLREMTRAEDTIHELKTRIRALENENLDRLNHHQLALQAQQDLKSYEPFEVATGVVVYALKVGDTGIPQMPYLCYACYQKAVKSPLTFEKATSPTQPAAFQCTEHRGHRFQLPRGFKIHRLTANKTT
jgi:hypothetical protein